MQSELLKLVNLISAHTYSLVDTCNSKKLTVPSIHIRSENELFHQDTAANLSAKIIATAAFQLISILTPPQEQLLGLLNGHYYGAALRLCIHLNIVEILRENGSKGMHAREIAEKCGIHAGKLERILRLLSLRHVFREGPPQFFSNNRLSEALDTGKPVQELQMRQVAGHVSTTNFQDPPFCRPMDKHQHTSGDLAMFEIRAEGPIFSNFLLETLTDPIKGFSEEPDQTVFQHAMGTNMSFWEYIDQPQQHYMRHRFNIAMRAWGANQDPESTILKSLDWSSLSKNAKIVDVGGGIGSAMMQLATKYPQFHFVVQDLPVVISEGINIWETKFPELIKTKRISFQASNFLEYQPVNDASIFHLRRVLHNWSDTYAKRILCNLRRAATSTTKLVVVELLLHPSCPDPINDSGKGIPSYKYDSAPEPLLANYGNVHEVAYMTDITMMTLMNGQDRTLSAMHELLHSSGWHIVQVHGSNEQNMSHIVAEPSCCTLL